MEIVSPVFLICIFLCTLVLVSMSRKSKPGSPPSPPCLPIIGNLHQIKPPVHHTMHSLSEKYGPLMMLHVGFASLYVVSSADLTREITKNQDSSFPLRPASAAAHVLFSGCPDLIFSPYGNYWRSARKLCVNELLSLKRVQSFHYIRQEEVARLVDKIRISCQTEKSAINLTSLFLTLAIDIISRAVLGKKYAGGRDNYQIIGELSKRAVELVTGFSFSNQLPKLAWLDRFTGHTAKLNKTAQDLQAFLNRVIDEHMHLDDAADQTDENNFVNILLKLRKDGMVGLDLTHGNIRAILLDMFVAGTTSAAAVMEWTMAEMVKNPTIMKKAQAEIRSIVGIKSTIEDHDITRMEYLQCVIKESLRLHSPFNLGRETSSDVTLGGFHIPAKSKVLMNLWAIHRDPILWEKPLEFLPERFINTSFGYKGLDDKYVPFGLGKRICPGAQFAVSEVEYAIANLLCWFDWKLPDGMASKDLDMSDTFAQARELPLHLVPVLKPGDDTFTP